MDSNDRYGLPYHAVSVCTKTPVPPKNPFETISSPLTGSVTHRPQGPEIRHNFGLAQVKLTCVIRYLTRGGGASAHLSFQSIDSKEDHSLGCVTTLTFT